MPASVVVAALLACAATGSAQTDLEAVLGKPVSPSAEVLLVPRGSDPRVQERWRGAIAHPSPEARATVARAIQMAGTVALASAVDQQLASESDLRAAVEQAATVTAIVGRISDNAREACKRLGPPVAAAVAHSLSRVAPAVLLTELPVLREHGADVDLALVQVLQRWLQAAPGQAARLQLALVRAGDEHAWRIVFKATEDAGLMLGGGPLATAIGSKRVGVATLALTYLLHLPDESFTATVAEAGVRPALERVTAIHADAAVRLGSALVGRRLGTPLPDDWLDDAARVPASNPLRRLGPAHVVGLPQEARAALARAWNVAHVPKRDADRRNTVQPRTGTMFIADLPAPLVHDVLRETRCQSRYASATVLVRYGADGRPATLVVSDDTKAACREVVGALVSLMPGMPGEEVSVIVPLDLDMPRGFGVRPPVQPRFVPTAWNAPHPADVGATLVKFVEPTFGPVSTRHKLADEVVFEIVVDETGAVTSLQFRRSVHPELNTTAARSIMQMKFSPSEVGGRVVPTRAQFSYSFDW